MSRSLSLHLPSPVLPQFGLLNKQGQVVLPCLRSNCMARGGLEASRDEFHSFIDRCGPKGLFACGRYSDVGLLSSNYGCPVPTQTCTH